MRMRGNETIVKCNKVNMTINRQNIIAAIVANAGVWAGANRMRARVQRMWASVYMHACEVNPFGVVWAILGMT